MIKEYFVKLQQKLRAYILKAPTLVRKIYELCFYFDDDYFYLKYHQTNIYLEKGKTFFELNKDKNIRCIFNYYNYLEKHKIVFDTRSVFDEYFKSKNILEIKKINPTQPLYINNITHQGSLENKLYLTKKVSIILTVFNGDILLEYSLQSLLNQTYKNIEIIVVDDGSQNEVNLFLQQFQLKYQSRIKIITLRKNHGTYVAKNIALSLATGDFITFHDADDWSHPQRIEEHIKLHLKDQKVKFSISKLIRITEDGYFYSSHIYPLDRLSMVSLMIDKSLIDEIGYFRTYRLGSDTEYFERLKKFTKYKWERIDKVLMFCSHRANSLTTSPETGVEGFGKTNKRQHYWNQWHKWHDILQKAKRKPFVKFDISKYEYEVLG